MNDERITATSFCELLKENKLLLYYNQDLIKEKKKLQNNWNELKKCIREWITYHSVCDEDYKELNVLEDVENKMQELEQLQKCDKNTKN